MLEKSVKWLLIGVVFLGIVLFGLVAYKNNWIDFITQKKDETNEYVETQGSPELDVEHVSIDSTILPVSYSRGVVKEVTDDRLLMDLITTNNNRKKVINTFVWKLDSETTAACMDDIYIDSNGMQRRRSEQFVEYKNIEEMILKTGWKVDWLLKNAKIGQPVMVFSNESNDIARTIYLYMDKCP